MDIVAGEEAFAAITMPEEEKTKTKIRLIVMYVFFASVFPLPTIVAVAHTLTIPARYPQSFRSALLRAAFL